MTTATTPNSAASRRPRAMSENTSLPRDCGSGSFVTKLYRMVDTEPSTIVTWIRGGTAFCIVDPKMMQEHCLPKYFRHRRFSSLIRQLNFYSFYRVQEGQLTIYQHSFFRKGRPDLLVHIKRRGAGKAKDPWFDPLATPNGKPNEPTSIDMSVVPLHSNPLPTPTSNPVQSICYSPISKPLSVENMSPALKPGTAQVTPPVVDLNSSIVADDKILDDLRWESAMGKDNQMGYPMTSVAQMKSEMLFDDITGMSAMHPSMSLVRTQSTCAPIDIDIQDFLTDECSINGGTGEMKNTCDERFCTSNTNNQFQVMNSKCAMVARDCLKWEMKPMDIQPCDHRTHDGSAHADNEAATFEDDLLMDLANVEPGAWDAPLSPLNDEEDMMPWLDLCF